MMSFVVKILRKKILVGRLRAITRMIRYPLRHQIFSLATRKLNLKIVQREELCSNKEKYNCLQFGFEECILVSKPSNVLDELPKLITSKIGTFTEKKPFVSEIVNAELLGPTAVGFDQDGNLISETVTPLKINNGLPIRTLILKNLPSFGTPQIDEACSLVNWAGRNYWHWMVDCLTRIEGLEYYREKTGTKPILIIESNPSPWQVESLRLLGYEPEDCMHWNMSRLKVKRLVVPSFRRGEERLVSPSACRWLRQRILSNLPDNGTENLSFSSRIYVSRSKTAGRQVINENDVMAALTPFGFVTYKLENMSFSDQVKLFSQAEIVVAPHGAGLTNIIFAQNLSVIEIFGSFGISAYFRLAKTLGFHYGCLISDSNSERMANPDSNQYGEKFKGMTVDIAKLQDLVAEMLSISDNPKSVGGCKPANTAF